MQTVAYCTYLRDAPNTYMVKRPVDEIGAYKDAQLFKLNSSHAFYRLSTEEVDDAFVYKKELGI